MQPFTPPTLDQWLEKANVDLKGVKTTDDLNYVVEEGLSVNPFLTSANTTALPPILGINTINGVHIQETDATLWNSTALSALAHGVQGLSIKLGHNTSWETLFCGIYLDMITLYVDTADVPNETRQSLSAYIDAQHPGHSQHILWKDKTLSSNLSYIDRQRYLAQWTNDADKLSIEVQLKKDFLAQIAELKSIRHRWSQLGKNPRKLHITTALPEILYTTGDRQDLIEIHYYMLSAYLGQADLVLSLPYTAHNQSIARLSQNIAHILTLETKVNQVQDPTAGAYIIDELIHQFLAI
jgi:hypothetical protein